MANEKLIALCKNISGDISDLEIKPTHQPNYSSLSIDMLIEDFSMNDDDKN